MFLLQPGLAALALLPVPFVVLIAARYGRISRPALTEVQQRIAELTADVEENVSGVRVVKAFAAEERQLERFRDSVARVFDQSMITTRLRAFYNPFIGFLPNLGLAVVLLVGGRQVVNGSLTLGDFTAFYAYLLMLIGPMRQLGIALGLAQRATASGARIFELLDREPRAGRPARRAAAAARRRPRRARRPSRSSTRRAATPALRDIDLVVEAGTTVALVGATGSGKTTLVQLLGRLYDVTAGSVRIDGADVRVGRPALAARRDRGRRRRPVPVLGQRARQHRLRAAGGHRARRSSSPPSARRRRPSSTRCRPATTRASASAA